MKKLLIIMFVLSQISACCVMAATSAPVAQLPVTEKQELKSDAAVVTQEVMKSLGVGAKQVGETALTGVNKLTTEAVNLFIFQGFIHIIYWCTIFILFYIVKKYVDFLQQSGFDEKKARALKTSMLIVSIAFFATQTMPHMMQITEAMVAPNIYIAKKGAEFVKDFQAAK